MREYMGYDSGLQMSDARMNASRRVRKKAAKARAEAGTAAATEDTAAAAPPRRAAGRGAAPAAAPRGHLCCRSPGEGQRSRRGCREGRR